jgi:hypothetical protein
MESPDPRPENEGVLRYLGQGMDPRDVAVRQAPDEVDRYHLGTHPDVVERIWDHLGNGMPPSARVLVGGGPGLLDPDSGLILAVALGTQYALRLTGRGLAAATEAGFETVHTFHMVNRTLDLPATFGSGWVFGGWDDREAAWLNETREAERGAG